MVDDIMADFLSLVLYYQHHCIINRIYSVMIAFVPFSAALCIRQRFSPRLIFPPFSS